MSSAVFEALGWRTWKLLETKTLHGWFTTGNTCSSGLDRNNKYQMADETTGGDVGNLIEWEPMIKNTHNGVDDLYVNTEMNTYDFNRLSTNLNSRYNRGAGLGARVNVNSCTTPWPRTCMRDCVLNSRKAPSTTNNTFPAVVETRSGRRQMPRCAPRRPAFGTIFPGLQNITKFTSLGLYYGHFCLVSIFLYPPDQEHWGSHGGMGGLIGSDHNCHGGCQWTISSGSWNVDGWQLS